MNNSENFFDVAVIGGGAAGLCFAVALAKKSPKLKIVILEALDRVGKKLSVTGNGQCNITNKNINKSRYHGTDVSFTDCAMQNYGCDYTVKFFKEIGVDIVFKNDGRAYPRSFQASSVVDCLRFAAKESGISVIYGCKVTDFYKKGNSFDIISDTGVFHSEYLVFATGLLSGGEKVGSFGNAVRILQNKGFSTAKMTPAIVQLKSNNPYLKRLKGIKLDAKVTLKTKGKIIKEYTDEVLFTNYGLSGPAVMQVSRETARSNENYEISLDLTPDISFEELVKNFKLRHMTLAQRTQETFLCGMFQNRLAQTLAVACNFDLTGKISDITEKKLLLLAKTVKEFSFTVTGNTGFINSQVTAGGIKTAEFDKKTMQSRRIRKLYAIGEILDIDGDCGGFNLAWCWASAFSAAQSIAGETK